MGQEEREQKKRRKITGKMQTSFFVVFCLFIVAIFVIMVRVVIVGNNKKYAKAALSQKTSGDVTVPFKRGSILDRNGSVLAESYLTYHVILDSRLLKKNEEYLEPTCRALCSVFGYSMDEIMGIIEERKESAYYRLKKNISYEEKLKFVNYEKELPKTADNKPNPDAGKIKGVTFEEEYQRLYPFGSLASHVIGYLRKDGTGSYGIEQQYNDLLTGRNGRIYDYYDAELLPRQEVLPAEDGCSVVSTIDSNLQRIIQNKVEAFLTDIGAKNVGVLMMDVNSAEILAMQSNYSYDLNNPRTILQQYAKKPISEMTDEETVEALYRQWRNFCISDTYEPGSTFKPFTVAGALEEKVINTEEKFLCDGGEKVADYTISCHNEWGHGLINAAQSIMLSCNDVLMEIAKREGRKIFSTYQRRFLFGQKTGIDLPGEEEGILIEENNIHDTELATGSFGMSFNTTMIQLGSAFCSLVNGGTYYEPHAVKEIRSAEGVVIKSVEPKEVCKTISEATSEFLRDAFYMTVMEGTAKAAQIPGYLIGGKTGTAQKLPRSAGKYVVSFIGNIPADKPQVMIYVVIDEVADEAKQDQASLASKLAAEILKEALPYLKIYPDGEIEYPNYVFDEKDVEVTEGEIGDTGVVYDKTMDGGNLSVIPDME